ncbi:hypothetical protein RHS01_11308 [Rhizoctonia solani]|uniref:Uncharacterized protein n=1 Tax=Rhizoctonia solani TaxID=456999 RepID=A0A8H7I1T0_9AGAM|nr:hypothetical protein RHS01_11308 [Rhizoctonia solani]
MTGAVIPILQQEDSDERRPNSYVVQAISPPPFATPVNIHPDSNTAIPGGLPTNQPPPEPRYNSQSSMNRVEPRKIAIHYGGSDPLPATYVDALNITHVLVKFGYHPKCIRVLADQVDVRDRKDDRWPNKDNIVRKFFRGGCNRTTASESRSPD